MQERADLKEAVQEIVLACIAEVTAQGWGRIQIEQGQAANILAGGGFIDSLGLTSLLVTIEQDVEVELGITINLTNTITEITPSSTNPLATVGTLTNYIVNCINNATVCGGV
ncbi:acyl carrier protein [Calothrix sp. FACHB-1219]|uniref:acyl carrier protein n=1 Tax=unclassified Calothrix TaxID=2619626 RepID=UPI001681F708|nr:MULTISPECIES: acyl carrier protein [unclassified Calothrix]MBD2202774.1 acyl carrier protein [Calothrix sp. FACHB-168]MBD2218927.1 acyl carrier protein [Calothrix sp. FACHB-1219]